MDDVEHKSILPIHRGASSEVPARNTLLDYFLSIPNINKNVCDVIGYNSNFSLMSSSLSSPQILGLAMSSVSWVPCGVGTLSKCTLVLFNTHTQRIVRYTHPATNTAEPDSAQEQAAGLSLK